MSDRPEVIVSPNHLMMLEKTGPDWPGKKGQIWIKATIVNKGVIGHVDKEYHVSKITQQESSQ